MINTLIIDWTYQDYQHLEWQNLFLSQDLTEVITERNHYILVSRILFICLTNRVPPAACILG
jgi:hypothetical protein